MTPIPPEKLHEVWDWVREGLLHIKRKQRESWIPEDVYYQLRNKTAFLSVVDGGFIVYQVLPGDDFRGVLHIWCMWGRMAPIAKQIEDELDAYAKQLGVRCIRAVGRRGWAKRDYFEQRGYVFEREVC